jgi:tRNA(Ile)-lysidine synthase TilS/MesJ
VTRIASNGACSAQPRAPSPRAPRPCSRAREARPGRLGELLDHLDAEHLGAELGHHRGLVAEPGADLEHARARGQLEQVEHQRADERLRQRLVEADRQRVSW